MINAGIFAFVVRGSLILPLLLCLLLSSTTAWAHRINIFAWLEGDNVIVRCGFNRSTPVKGGKIAVVDSATGRLLSEGVTDSDGAYVFKVPDVVREGHGLRITVKAGGDHASEFAMNASEFYEAAALEAGFEKANIDAARLDATAATPSVVPAQAPPPLPPMTAAGTPPLGADDVRQIVDKTLQQHLAPIHRALETGGGFSFGDILAGLGWIMGIIGIICYFRARHPK